MIECGTARIHHQGITDLFCEHLVGMPDYQYITGSAETAGFNPVFGSAVLGARLRFGAVRGMSGTVFGGEDEDVEIWIADLENRAGR